MPSGYYKHTKEHNNNISRSVRNSIKFREALRKLHERSKTKNGINIQGYRIVYVKNHPLVTNKNGFMKEHRLIMEKWLRKNEPKNPALTEINGKKYLSREYIVHHKNKIRHDNRIENLEVMLRAQHSPYIGSFQISCPKCGFLIKSLGG